MTEKEKINFKKKVTTSLVNKGYYKTSEEALAAFDGITVPYKNNKEVAKSYECSTKDFENK